MPTVFSSRDRREQFPAHSSATWKTRTRTHYFTASPKVWWAGVQNSAARLVSGTRRYDRNMHVLLELHWLPVRRRVDFKMATLVYVSSMALAYLAVDCQLASEEGRRQLRSATSRTCVVRRTYNNYGDRCFAAAGPKLWNCLPSDLRQADISFLRFKRLLKHFCSGAEIAAHSTVKLRLISFLTNCRLLLLLLLRTKCGTASIDRNSCSVLHILHVSIGTESSAAIWPLTSPLIANKTF